MAALAAKAVEAQEAFGYYDRDGDGKIDVSEVMTVMQAIGQYPTEEEMNKIIGDVAGGAKQIDYATFSKMMMMKMRTSTSWQADILDAFRHFDEDGNGFITSSELQHAMTVLGEKLSREQAEEFIRTADIDGDGQINYNEFVKMLTQ